MPMTPEEKKGARILVVDDEPEPGSLKDVNLAEVTERITDSTSKLQELADRLKEMKRKKD
jgi:DNA polymerase IIIc chi subunit